MSRFRTGTLGRSVARWGRMPRFGSRAPFKRRQFAWKFFELEEDAVDTSGATVEDFILFDSTDWTADTGSSNPTGCKNVTLDMRVGLSWTPDLSAANIYNSAGWGCGIWCLDADDTGGTINNHFAAQRPIWWDHHYMMFTSGTTTVPNALARQWNKSVKCRQRYMGFDDELRFKFALDSSVASQVSDMRIGIFGRVSWEIP